MCSVRLALDFVVVLGRRWSCLAAFCLSSGLLLTCLLAFACNSVQVSKETRPLIHCLHSLASNTNVAKAFSSAQKLRSLLF